MNLDPIITRVTPRRTPLKLVGALVLLLFLLLVGVGNANAQAASVCRVTTAGAAANDGASWATPKDLQAALAEPGCTELWVASGVHHPVVLADPLQPTPAELATSFAIPAGVAVYGGFTGTESSRAARDPVANLTALSGDLTDADTTDVDGVVRRWEDLDLNAPHSQQVVTLTGTAAAPIDADTVLDGFTITAGVNLDGSTSAASLSCGALGGGARCNASLTRLVLVGNVGATGGGMLVFAMDGGVASPSLSDVLFEGNRAGNGGGLLIAAGDAGSVASPFVTRVAFIGNTADGAGALANLTLGGVANATFANVTFHGNSGQSFGAVMNMANVGTANPVFRHVTFHANQSAQQVAAVGNGASTGASAEITFHDVIVWPATAGATAFFNQGDASMSFDHAIIQGGCPTGATCANVSSIDPQLGALGDHGGFTPTLVPHTGSPAVDAGTACSGVDQRGHARPSGPACDIGAVEVDQAGVAVVIHGDHGTVTAAAAPAPNGAPLHCGSGGSVCTAWYDTEFGAPLITLLLTPNAGYAVTAATGCAGTLVAGHYTIAALDADCTVDVTFAVETHRVGGTVTGLAGSGLVLALDNGAQTLAVAVDGPFAFPDPLEVGASYAVDIATQPGSPNQTCAVINGNGTLGERDVDDVIVNCGAAATYTVGGNLSGLATGASITLAVNGANPVTLAADGAWVFPVTFAPGAGYVASIAAQPNGQHCTLANASGTVGTANVSNVDVNCAAGGPNLVLTVDDGASYAAYGTVRDYFVMLTNNGDGSASNVSVGAAFDAAFDEPNTLWMCINGSPTASCTAQGSGGFADSATLAPGDALVWVVSVPVLGGSSAASATFTVHADGASSAADTDTLVIFRDGLDVPYANPSLRPDAVPAAVLDGRHNAMVSLAPAAPGLRTLKVLRSGQLTVQLQQLSVDGRSYVRIAARRAGHDARATAWTPADTDATLAIGSVAGEPGRRLILLEGAAAPLALRVTSP